MEVNFFGFVEVGGRGGEGLGVEGGVGCCLGGFFASLDVSQDVPSLPKKRYGS